MFDNDDLRLDGLPAGPALADLVESLQVEELDESVLIDAIHAWDRLASWAAARQLAAIAELARRRPPAGGSVPDGHADAGDPRAPWVSEFAVDEVSAALGLSRPAAGVRLHLAVELDRRLVGTAAALRAGEIDVVKARAVVEATTPLDDAAARAVEAGVLRRAAGQTVGQLRASLSRAVLAVDPAAAEVRHERAAADRHVTVSPLPDGMAELWALLPADGAVAVREAVDTLARRDRAVGDSRGIDARRADALVGMAVAVLDGDGATAPETSRVGAVTARSDTRSGGRHRTRIFVTVPATTALGLADEPGELSGYGPVPAAVARRLTAVGTWRRVATDPTTGVVLDVGRRRYTPAAALAELVVARDVTCRFPGCRQPAHRCDLPTGA